MDLGDNPFKGVEPRYLVLKRQGYKVLILEKNIVFYKVDEQKERSYCLCRCRPETGLFKHYQRVIIAIKKKKPFSTNK